MIRERILIVDDDEDILDVLSLAISEHYDVVKAHNGQEALTIIQSKAPNLIVSDYMMPIMDGRKLCETLKKDILLQHIPIIMLTGKGEIKDKVDGIASGADDYLVKPFEPEELLARIRMILRRTERSLDANPLTHLPGNVSIMEEFQKRIDSQKDFAVGYVDINKFKSYNDKYGFERGDDVIRETAKILICCVKEFGSPGSFIGHIGGDDFVFVTSEEAIEKVCQKVIEAFDALSPSFYSEEDRKTGYIITRDRQGHEEKFAILSIAIGIVSTHVHKITHIAQIGEIGAELKKYAKSLSGSTYVQDKRKN